MPGLKVLKGKLGNAGKSPTERHKPRKSKQVVRQNQDKASAGEGSSVSNADVAAGNEPSALDQDLALTALGHAHLALSQDNSFVNNRTGPSATAGPTPMDSSAVEYTSPAPSQFSGYHSAPMSRDASLAGPSTGYVAAPYSGFHHAPQQPVMCYEPSSTSAG
ncbi:uncharacterized protein J3D65DRAFT_631379 [Phyllosticta citribraziliensis]|uniref:Uncharacterized protein n=1 Tax=Phyllosticta citribraziliensis TaxID=989973 RepID=A0ABR1LF05_9PEZI